MKGYTCNIENRFCLPMLKAGTKFTLMRIGIVSLLAILTIAFIGMLFNENNHPGKDLQFYIFAIIAFNVLSEGNMSINRWFDHHHPWFFRVWPRIIKQLLLSLLWTTFIGLIFYMIMPRDNIDRSVFVSGFALSFVFGAVFVLIFDAILFIQSFIQNWKISFKENEQLKLDKLNADYQILQNQLNPHFLFNSLSVLISEIRFNSHKAEKFARKMADVYRYVLKCKDLTTVTLEKELKFIENYVYMHRIRQGDALQFNIDIPSEMMQCQLPPLTLQLLVENAIKHNSATQKHPLNISIYIEEMNLVIRNNLQLKSVETSIGTGLNNLNSRYKLITGNGFTKEITNEYFTIRLPLID